VNWRYTIDLAGAMRQSIDDFDLTRLEEPCPAAVLGRLADEVEKAPPLSHFGTRLRAAKSIAEVNRLLIEVYDRADDTRVWCGL